FALKHAAEKESFEILKILLEAGADVHSGNGELLRLAAQNGRRDIVRLLLDWGADPGVCDTNSRSALDMASEKGHCSVIRLLLNFDPGVCDTNSRSALDMASEKGHCSVIRLLLNFWMDVNA
ncbi:ankyrin repeat protein, partial [Gonapodya prolifera JEL478]